jgi:hypothetical protein
MELAGPGSMTTAGDMSIKNRARISLKSNDTITRCNCIEKNCVGCHCTLYGQIAMKFCSYSVGSAIHLNLYLTTLSWVFNIKQL